MEALERYVVDCESKRRRMRDRPSDAVVSALRSLLDWAKAIGDRPVASEDGPSGSEGELDGVPRG